MIKVALHTKPREIIQDRHRHRIGIKSAIIRHLGTFKCRFRAAAAWRARWAFGIILFIWAFYYWLRTRRAHRRHHLRFQNIQILLSLWYHTSRHALWQRIVVGRRIIGYIRVSRRTRNGCGLAAIWPVIG